MREYQDTCDPRVLPLVLSLAASLAFSFLCKFRVNAQHMMDRDAPDGVRDKRGFMLIGEGTKRGNSACDCGNLWLTFQRTVRQRSTGPFPWIALRIREIPRQIRRIGKMTFRKMPRVRRAHRSYPIIALTLENRMIARQGATKARGVLSQRDQWQSFKPR